MRINGINIGNCNSVVMVNGSIVSGGGSFGKSQKFDEKKNVYANDVQRIIVKSNTADVVVNSSDTNIIEAHFHGEAIVDEKPTFNIEKKGHKVVITINIKGNVMGRLTLTVNIPTRTLELLNVINYNGDISVENGIFAKKIRLDTHNGDVESEGNFSEISATTHNGDVDVYIDAKNNIQIEASSHNGNVSVELQNVATNNIYISTYNGNKKNHFRGRNDGYSAYGRATSYNGNVAIK